MFSEKHLYYVKNKVLQQAEKDFVTFIYFPTELILKTGSTNKNKARCF